MLTYEMEERGSVPLYEFLYRKIRQDILSGALPARERLPSKRQLASHLHVSVVTVQRAYEQLLAEGFLYSEEKKGYYVCELETDAGLFLPERAEKGGEIGAAGEADAEHDARYRINFKDNRVSVGSFPFSVWARIMRDVASEKEKTLLEPLPAQGLYALRSAISRHIRAFRGAEVPPERIMIGAGTEYLYNILIQLLGHDRIYAVENPGHDKITRIYRANGVACRFTEVDGEGISVRMLAESGADIAHVSPSHHFPTGVVTSAPRRRQLINWANEKKDRYIIEDDYDSEFRFDRKPLPTLLDMDTGGRVIYMNTFSKSIAPSIRISYMVLPESLASVFREKLGFYSCSVSSLEQQILAEFIGRGFFEKHLNRMRRYYKGKRDAVIETIVRSGLARKEDIFEKEAGLHFTLYLDTGKSDAEITREAEQAGMKIAFLSEYYNGTEQEAPQHFAVINYSGLDLEGLAEAAAVLRDIACGSGKNMIH